MSQDHSKAEPTAFSSRSYKLAVGFFVFGLGQASALLSVILISHKLSTDAFGQLSTGLAIQNYVVLTGTLGLRTVLVRDLARAPDQLGSVWGSFWSIVAPAGALVTILGYFTGGWIYTRTDSEALMSLWLAIGAWFSMLSVIPLLDGMSRQILGMTTGAIIEVLFLLGIALGIIPMSISTLGAAFALKWGSLCILQVLSLVLTTKSVQFRASKLHLRNWIRSAPPLLLTTLIVNVPVLGTVLFIRYFLGEKEAGVAGLGAQLANALMLFGGIGIRFIQPVWHDWDSLQKSSNSNVLVLMGLGWGLLWLIFSSIAALIVNTWLPDEYQRHLIAIEILIGAGALGIISRILWIALLAMNRERAVWSGYCWGTIAFVVLCIILTPVIGIYGTTIAAFLGTILTCVILLYVVRFEISDRLNSIQNTSSQSLD